MSKVKTPNQNLKDYKKSALGELNLVSSSVMAIMVVITIVCIVIYGVLIQSPSKKIKVVDDAGILTRSEIEELESMAKKLSKRDDINVVIVTTRDKDDTINQRGKRYSNSDEDCAQFAGDYYAKTCIKHNFRDNSGICILVDLTLDYSGGRYFWLYTYGTAYYAISDDEASGIFRSHRGDLSMGLYGDALVDILDDVSDYDFDGTGVKVAANSVLIIPLILAALTVALISASKKLDSIPSSSHYFSSAANREYRNVFERESVSVHYVSDSSSSSSGGGFHGGGGFSGGGHSGGGGGRF